MGQRHSYIGMILANLCEINLSVFTDKFISHKLAKIIPL